MLVYSVCPSISHIQQRDAFVDFRSTLTSLIAESAAAVKYIQSNGHVLGTING